MNRRVYIAIFCVVFALLIALIKPVRAVPSPPHTVWGVVTIDGAPAPNGTTIRILANGVEYASTDVFDNTDGAGRYTVNIPSDDESTTIVDGASMGDDVAFVADGVRFSETLTWAEGEVTNLDLTGNRTTAPIANFTCSPRSGLPPLEVTCEDTSTGNVTSRQWDFGDGGNSTLETMTFTYDEVGEYSISLRVSGPEGTDALTRPGYISVVETVAPRFTPARTPTSTWTPTPRGTDPSASTPTPTSTSVSGTAPTPTVTSSTDDESSHLIHLPILSR